MGRGYGQGEAAGGKAARKKSLQDHGDPEGVFTSARLNIRAAGTPFAETRPRARAQPPQLATNVIHARGTVKSRGRTSKIILVAGRPDSRRGRYFRAGA